MMKIYQAQILEQNTWLKHEDGTTSGVVRTSCGHNHRTLSGVARCLRSQERYYKNGGHNEWAHNGTVREITDGHSRRLSDDDSAAYEEIILNATCR